MDTKKKSQRLIDAEERYQKFFAEQLESFPEPLKKEAIFVEAFKTFGELCYFRGATDAVMQDVETIQKQLAKLVTQNVT